VLKGRAADFYRVHVNLLVVLLVFGTFGDPAFAGQVKAVTGDVLGHVFA